MDKCAITRNKFQHEGRTIYEWDQSVDEVNIYIDKPADLPTKMLAITITAGHLSVAIKGNPPYLDEDFWGSVKSSNCFWTIEDGIIHITLEKLSKAQAWPAALKRHMTLGATQLEQEKKNMLLQRFQAEHPGYDFSGAEVTGNFDAETFLGGMDSNAKI
eukprot:TRINITY_DN13248_c0_g1_i1.p3 TRINITY_DN13248_c0_g1~~TRINITY_DN13248_c0_g1_i1.p3  ORF type:complete len:159 (+),score=84.94 TRINITY_DN13248_c0_g1_i1:472-948(+)